MITLPLPYDYEYINCLDLICKKIYVNNNFTRTFNLTNEDYNIIHNYQLNHLTKENLSIYYYVLKHYKLSVTDMEYYVEYLCTSQYDPYFKILLNNYFVRNIKSNPL